jgi:hypothetical protein
MAKECSNMNSCKFYKKYKNNYAAFKAFITPICSNNLAPCARKMMEAKKIPVAENLSPCGTYL